MHTVDAAGLAIGDGHPPRVMGVLNVSEESPYDPSVFADPGEAAAYVADEVVGQGADIVDVGLESANKRFEALSADAELDRLDTAVQAMESTSESAVWSIETRYADVAAEALDRGFDMVNDIAGFADSGMPAVCREYDVAVVKMASPPDLTRPGAVEETPWGDYRSTAWAAEADFVDQVYEALQRNGFTDKTIVDPAFGRWSESQTVGDDRETLRRLREFRGLGRPILVSLNRKTFLRTLTGRSTEGALPVSLAATSLAVERGAAVVRTHDVAETVDAVAVGDAFARERTRTSGPVAVAELDVTTPGELARHAERMGVDVQPDEAVSRVYEVHGDTAASREQLAAAAADTGCFVAFAHTGDVAWCGLLYGCAGALARLSERPDAPTLFGDDSSPGGGPE
jgi:dihydropteroate synthase